MFTEDDPHIVNNYYTIHQVSRKLGISILRLKKTIKSKETYFPTIKIGKKYFIRKDLVDGVTNIEEIQTFSPTKGLVLVDHIKKFVHREFMTSPHAYAITLATKANPYGNYDYIYAQNNLEEFLKRCNNKFFGKNWQSKNAEAVLFLMVENKNHNVHYHGFICFSEEYRASRRQIENIIQRKWQSIYRRGTVEVATVFHAHHWINYSMKQVNNKPAWRGKENFNASSDNFIIVMGG